MISCAMDLPYPACVNGTSLLTTVIWVASSVCYEAGYRPGCTMPATNVSTSLTPVYIPPGRTVSALRSEELYSGPGHAKPAASTIHVNSSGGELTVTTANTAVVAARPDVYLDTLTIAAPGVKVDSVAIETLRASAGINPGAISLKDVTLGNTVAFLPTPQQHTIGVDGAVFSGITGGAVALFRHRGKVTCSGATTRCFVLGRSDPGAPSGTVVSTDGATVVDVSAITGVVGASYLVSFFTFNQEAELGEASRLAGSLVLPTVIALFSIWLAHGPRAATHYDATVTAIKQSEAVRAMPLSSSP